MDQSDTFKLSNLTWVFNIIQPLCLILVGQLGTLSKSTRLYNRLLQPAIHICLALQELEGSQDAIPPISESLLHALEELFADLDAESEQAKIHGCHPTVSSLSRTWSSIRSIESTAPPGWSEYCQKFPALKTYEASFLSRISGVSLGENTITELSKYAACFSSLTNDTSQDQGVDLEDDQLSDLEVIALMNPTSSIHKLAITIHQVLQNCTSCECKEPHIYSLRLALSTQRRAFRKGPDTKPASFDLQMRTSHANCSWQQASIALREESLVTGSGLKGHLLVRSLCKQIKVASKHKQRLHFAVKDGRLFRRNTPSDRTLVVEHSISLYKLITEGGSLRPNTARIMATILAYAALYLVGTPWLDRSWNNKDIIFLFQTSKSISPQPYLGIDLIPSTMSKSPASDREHVCDEECFGCVNAPIHDYPALASLGLILMEIYSGMTGERFAKAQGLEYNQENGDYLLGKRLFANCRLEMPINYRAAVNACFDDKFGDDGDGGKVEDNEFRKRVYSRIIVKIEKELRQYYDEEKTLDELDALLGGQDHNMPGEQTWIDSAEDPSLDAQPVPTEHSKENDEQTSYITNTADRNAKNAASSNMTSKMSRFFHDETVGNINKPNENASDNFKNQYSLAYNSRFGKYLESLHADESKVVRHCVKIAILDSGIDYNHPYIRNSDQIRDIRSWTNGNHGLQSTKASIDMIGHGSHIVGIVQDFAPHADVYIGRIAEEEPGDAAVIAEAVEFACARDQWNVDIIVMSFGWQSEEDAGCDSLVEAIQRASRQGVLMFAAASNYGALAKAAFPARLPNVFCINASNGLGRPSDFNPLQQTGSYNFCTLGEAVESFWPTTLCTSPWMVRRCGTSYATPIAACIAAFVLLFARIHLTKQEAEKLKSYYKMREMLKIISVEHRSYEFLEVNGFFGAQKEEAGIIVRIREVLRGLS